MSERQYQIDQDSAFAAVIVRNDDSKLLSRLGHDHVIRASRFDATVVVDEERPEALNLTLSFPVDALIVDADEDRRRASLDGSVSDKDKKATRDNMLAKGQLFAKKFQTITFRVDGANPTSGQEWILNANLTVRDKSFDFPFAVQVSFEPRLRVFGKADLTHSNLGLKPYKAPMGALRNREELTFMLQVEADPQ